MINWKAWRDVDGEVVYIREGDSGEGLIGPGHTRVPGLDRVSSADESLPEDFTSEAYVDAADITLQNQINTCYDSASFTGSILTLTSVDNVDTIIDLSSLQGGVNLARIVSASIDSSNILTLTRDDATNITLDISQLDQSADIAPLIGGSNVDILHQHSELHSPDGTKKIVQVNDNSSVDFGENGEIKLQPGSNQRLLFNDIDSGNVGSIIINDSETVITTDDDIDPSITNSNIKLRASGNDLVTANQNDIRLHVYPSTRDDGPVNKNRIAYFDADGRLQVGLHRQTQYTQLSGRFEIDTDDDWASWSDPNFGPSWVDWDLDLGNNATPNIDWDGIGLLFPLGATLKRMFVKVRGNNNDIETVQLNARVHDVSLISQSPIDSNGEIGAFDITTETIDLDEGPADGNDVRGFEIDLQDYTFNNAGDLHVAMRSVPGTTTANRNLRCTIFIEWELP